MQSPSLQKQSESSQKSDQYIQGWLPIKTEVEQSIITYLDSLGINQLIVVDKFQNQQRNSLLSIENVGTPQSQKILSLNLDSELCQRRSFRLSSDQI
ncbi:unnamed protein product [Paramecium pentaurelia]|uniref:Uncharacterized protein n=1 Tax=Paramecium pentaurelia TaxID=43138 RepID=A0A8S1WU14_9CILI|nr:unnamed protein product [Paramecium pentaurelia]